MARQPDRADPRQAGPDRRLNPTMPAFAAAWSALCTCCGGLRSAISIGAMRMLRVTVGGAVAVATIAAVLVNMPGPAAARNDDACSARVSLTGHSDVLDKSVFDGRQVSGLSALATDAAGRVSVLSDRSVLFTLDSSKVRPIRAVYLHDEAGQELDSEGLAIQSDGTRLVASEVEPSVRAYSPGGQFRGRLPVPDLLKVAPAGRAMENRTFEGLSLVPGGRSLVASMEAWITSDNDDLRRIQTWIRHGNSSYRLSEQYAYRADERHGISDITAIGHRRLLILERTANGDTWGARLYLANTQRASDVSDRAELTGHDDVTLVSKMLLADLGHCPGMDSSQPGSLLDNVEGMTVTAGAPGGRLRLLLVSDDNGSAEQVTRLYSLTVDVSR